MIVMLVQVIVGTLPATLLLGQTHPLRGVLGAAGITLAALLLVYLVRRFLDRRPWGTLGWRHPLRILPGVLAGALPAVVANLIALAAGASVWKPVEASAYLGLPLFAVVTLLNQAFPEELLWRGHVFETLSQRLSPRAVVVVVSAGFGVMHIISQGPVTTVLERVLYVVMAVALGFACTAGRVRGGGLWMAAGVHLGFHLGMRLLPLEFVNFGVTLALLTGTLTLAGLIMLRSGTKGVPEPVTGAQQPGSGRHAREDGAAPASG